MEDDELFEYDKNGNLIHFKNRFGLEVWHEYDKNGYLIHTKNNSGFEEIIEWSKDYSNNRTILPNNEVIYTTFIDGKSYSYLEEDTKEELW